MKESLINKYYQCSDNSYAVNITSSARYPYKNEQLYLAGTVDENGVLCKIVSEPFNVRIGDDSVVREHTMIMVDYDNKTSCVLFREDNVYDTKTHSNGIPLSWDDNF